MRKEVIVKQQGKQISVDQDALVGGAVTDVAIVAGPTLAVYAQHYLNRDKSGNEKPEKNGKTKG